MEKALSLFPESVFLLGKKALRLTSVLLLWGAAVWALAALLSYDPYDPSWNTSIEGGTSNWGHESGGYFADFFLQGIGFSSYFLPLILFIWGSITLGHRSFSYPVARLFSFLMLFPASSVLFATGKAGGVFGEIALRTLEKKIHQLGAFPVDIVFIASLLLSVVLLYFSSGLRLKDTLLLIKCLRAIARFFSRSLDQIVSLLRKSRTGHGRALSDHHVEPVGGAVFADFRSDNVQDQDGYDYQDVPAPEQSFLRAEQDDLHPQDTSALNRGGEENEKQSRFWNRTASKEEKNLPSKSHSKKSGEGIIDLSQITCDYQLPSMDLLKKPVLDKRAVQTSDDLDESAEQLSGVLDDYGVRGEITSVCPGPVVTLYELTPAPGVKSSRVTGLADDIARSMCALSARVSTIPGQNAMGIELPNKVRQTVFLRELLCERRFEGTASKLALALGKDIGGRSVIADLARMPHLLVAGTTGSGKSVAINTMILSLLYRLPPEKCRFLMIDPKMLELSIYNDIPHLLAPVVTDPKKAIVALNWAVREMEDRYKSMSRVGVRNIEGYNARLAEAKKKGEELTRQVHTGFDPETGKPIYETQHLNMDQLPYIVVIVDEMADLMMVAGKEIEAAVQRLAQMARAAGIHLIMATQRPSVDVITGTIKANFPTRISFQVTSKFDSRTILGEQGAEQLLGRGDMLYMEAGGKTQRVHGPFVSDEEVESVVTYLKDQGVPEYVDGVTDESADTPLGSFGGDDSSDGDALYQQAVDLVLREGKASTSFVQRHLQIGYNRAARLIEQMESEGLISAANHVGKREVLMKKPA